MAEQLDRISLVNRQICAIQFCVRLGKGESQTLQLIHEATQSTSLPMRFLGFSNHEKGVISLIDLWPAPASIHRF
jgi:hypothetical protein